MPLFSSLFVLMRILRQYRKKLHSPALPSILSSSLAVQSKPLLFSLFKLFPADPSNRPSLSPSFGLSATLRFRRPLSPSLRPSLLPLICAPPIPTTLRIDHARYSLPPSLGPSVHSPAKNIESSFFLPFSWNALDGWIKRGRGREREAVRQFPPLL